MNQPLANFLGYERMVSDMLKAFPEDEAMSRAVGGNFEYYGMLEHCVLLHAGLFPTARVLDIGCGSGRLAVQLARYPKLFYHGTDIVSSLLDYARKRVGRADFHFTLADGFRIPHAEETMDFVCLFSVVTHLLHEESFAYLAEALRVLRPGGKAVLSFLDPCLEEHWPIFREGVEAVSQQAQRGHLNTFIHKDQLASWAGHLGAQLSLVIPGNERFIEVGPGLAEDVLPAGRYAFGQSIAVLTKCQAGTAAPKGRIMGFADSSPTPRHLCGWARMEGSDAAALDIEVVQRGRVIGFGSNGLQRQGLGPFGFEVALQEALDDDAFIAGQVIVRARSKGGEAVPLQIYDKLEEAIRHRRALRLLEALPEAARSAVLKAWGERQ